MQLRNWYFLRESFNSYGRVWIFKKNTLLKGKMDKYIQRLTEAGLVNLWHKVRLEVNLLA